MKPISVFFAGRKMKHGVTFSRYKKIRGLSIYGLLRTGKKRFLSFDFICPLLHARTAPMAQRAG